MRKIELSTLAYFAMIIMATAILTGLYWTVFPRKVFEFNHPLVLLDSNPVAVGHVLQFEMDYCKYTETTAEVHYSLVGEVRYDLSGPTASSIPSGCHTVEQGVMVPPVPSGLYRLEMLRVYQPNRLRIIEVKASTPPFEVIDK